MGVTYYTVTQITGDYAKMISDDGVENLVAMALLPPETDEGVRLCCENFMWSLA